MLKLVSCNIEGHRHFDERLLPFLEKEQPEFMSLQEVFEVDVPALKEKFGMDGQFWPMGIINDKSIHFQEPLGSWGVLQLTNLPIKSQGHEYYLGAAEPVPVLDLKADPNSSGRVLEWMTVEKDGQEYTFATTHFIWTPNGDPTELQHTSLAKMWQILATLPPYVLSGDLNAPRGRAIFDEIATRLHDNIPPEVTTSIDGNLHKAGKLELMVDGLFSTPEYQLTKVRVESNVSDHKALVAEVSRIK
jgi:endonuclease/exonuclease/phosphatase family metal-dependent hydrolase